MIKRNRVVITGIGVLAPNGIGLDAFWESLLAGRSGIGPITLFDATQFKSRIAGEVKNFDPLEYIEPEWKPKRMARHTQLAYAAAMMALRDAGLDPDNLELPSPTPTISATAPPPPTTDSPHSSAMSSGSSLRRVCATAACTTPKSASSIPCRANSSGSDRSMCSATP
jgi:hypothetical protein